MVARPKIDRQVMRAHNRAVVLDTVRRLGPLARTEVARQTSLAKPTLPAASVACTATLFVPAVSAATIVYVQVKLSPLFVHVTGLPPTVTERPVPTSSESVKVVVTASWVAMWLARAGVTMRFVTAGTRVSRLKGTP